MAWGNNLISYTTKSHMVVSGKAVWGLSRRIQRARVHRIEIFFYFHLDLPGGLWIDPCFKSECE